MQGSSRKSVSIQMDQHLGALLVRRRRRWIARHGLVELCQRRVPTLAISEHRTLLLQQP